MQPDDWFQSSVTVSIGDMTFPAYICEVKSEFPHSNYDYRMPKTIIIGKIGYPKGGSSLTEGKFTIELYGEIPNKKPNWRKILER